MKSDPIKALGKAALIAALLNAASFSTSNAAAFAEGIPSAGRSMPQALVESAKATVVERFLADTGVAYRIDAAAWQPSATASTAKSAPMDAERSKPVQIGYPREIAAELRALPLASLAWTTQSDGSRTTHVQVLTSDAAGLRIAYPKIYNAWA